MAILQDSSVDLESLRYRLQAWLQRQSGWADGEIVSLSQASSANGFSNETYRLELRNGSAPASAHILRLPPARTGLFPDYDLSRQYAFMHNLEGVPALGIAACRWLETDPEVLGRPFFITDFVAGRVAPDNPCYVREGWIAEATPAQQSTLWRSSLDQLVHLAGVRWSPAILAGLDWPDPQRPRILQHLDHWARIAGWGRAQLPAEDDRFLREIHEWLKRNAPEEDIPGVVWGDARFGNIIYRDFEPVALLDWELAGIGDPMIDLSYMLFHVFLMELYHGDAATAERFRGFDGDAGSVAYYCGKTGRDPRLHAYYWVFNAYRILCIWQCKAAMMHRAGEWPMEQALALCRAERLVPYVHKVMAGDAGGGFMRESIPG